MKLRHALLSTTFLAAIVAVSSPALAADVMLAPVPMQRVAVPLVLPAVSAPNGKLAIFGGGFDADGASGAIFGVEGAFSIPLGMRYGLQVDGTLKSVDGDFSGSVAGHLFWRDPNFALLGLYAAWQGGGGSSGDNWRVGVEGEGYFGNMSLEGLLGWEHANIGSGSSRLFALADVAFYPTDNFRVAVGYRYWGARHIGALGAEYLLPANFLGGHTALFAEGRVGSDSYVAAWGGVRLYFGPQQKTLIRRHREDDPRVREELGGGGVDICEQGTFSLVEVCALDK